MSVNVNDFGTRIAAFGWNRGRARKLFWIHFPLALLHLPFAFVVIGLPGFLLFGWFAWRSLRRWRNAEPVFELHEHGVVDRRGAQPRRFRYDALAAYALVERLWRFPFPFSFVQVHNIGLVARLGGRHFGIDEHLADIRRCIALLQEGIVRQRLPVLREHLAQGAQPRFGHLFVSKAGLHIAKRALPWSAFAGLRSGAWRIGRRFERALQILDNNGQQWDVLTRAEITDPALFILLVADRAPSSDTATLLRDFCGMEMKERTDEAA